MSHKKTRDFNQVNEHEKSVEIIKAYLGETDLAVYHARTFTDILENTPLTRRTVSKTLKELVSKGEVDSLRYARKGKVLDKKRIYYALLTWPVRVP